MTVRSASYAKSASPDRYVSATSPSVARPHPGANRRTTGYPLRRTTDDVGARDERRPQRVTARLTTPRGCLAGNGFAFASHVGDVCGCGFLPLSVGNVRDRPFSELYRDAPLFEALRDRRGSAETAAPARSEQYAAAAGHARKRRPEIRSARNPTAPMSPRACSPPPAPGQHARSLTPRLSALMIPRSSGRHVVRQKSHRVVAKVAWNPPREGGRRV
jgi:hypothetical protein